MAGMEGSIHIWVGHCSVKLWLIGLLVCRRGVGAEDAGFDPFSLVLFLELEGVSRCDMSSLWGFGVPQRGNRASLSGRSVSTRSNVRGGAEEGHRGHIHFGVSWSPRSARASPGAPRGFRRRRQQPFSRCTRVMRITRRNRVVMSRWFLQLYSSVDREKDVKGLRGNISILGGATLALLSHIKRRGWA